MVECVFYLVGQAYRHHGNPGDGMRPKKDTANLHQTEAANYDALSNLIE